MPFKFKRICPICGKEELQNISTHFSVVHNLDSVKRKQWLKLAKYQTMNTVYSRSTPRVGQLSKSIVKGHKQMEHTNKSANLIRYILEFRKYIYFISVLNIIK